MSPIEQADFSNPDAMLARWQCPERFNIAAAIEAQAQARDAAQWPAVIEWTDDATTPAVEYNFAELLAESRHLAACLRQAGIGPGDPVGYRMPQAFRTAALLLAIFRIGAVAMPLFRLLGNDAIAHRLQMSGAKLAIFDDEPADSLFSQLRAQFHPQVAMHRFAAWRADAPPASDAAVHDCRADSPAVLLFTSGTTGQPKGALLPHSTLIGHLSGFEMSHAGYGYAGDRFWTPADWAWAGGMFDALIPALYHTTAVVVDRSAEARFNPERAERLIAACSVRNTFIPPAALRKWHAHTRQHARKNDTVVGKLRSIASGGEGLPHELMQWATGHFGVPVNEFYGQSECNLIISSCHQIGISMAGTLGQAVPGHVLGLFTPEGMRAGPNEPAELHVLTPDAVMFVGYHADHANTEKKHRVLEGQRWLSTGDCFARNPEGYYTYLGRYDELLNVSGYRIGPAELEHAISNALPHLVEAVAAVQMQKPDGADAIRLYVVLIASEGAQQTEHAKLVSLCREAVKTRIGAHAQPWEVVFVDELPGTITGKIQRLTLKKGAT